MGQGAYGPGAKKEVNSHPQGRSGGETPKKTGPVGDRVLGNKGR